MQLTFSMFTFFIGILAFSWNQQHILNLLLSLEIMSLSLFSLLMLSTISNSFEMVISFLSLIVCEACLGLSLLISIIHFFGKDLFQSLNILNS